MSIALERFEIVIRIGWQRVKYAPPASKGSVFVLYTLDTLGPILGYIIATRLKCISSCSHTITRHIVTTRLSRTIMSI